MSKFKVGDLALIRKSQYPENLGKVVEVIGVDCPVVDHCPINIKGESLVASESPFRSVPVVVQETWAGEADLMPLRGDLQPEQERETELSQ